MELILEIGTEELPASFIMPALVALKEQFLTEMERQRVYLGQVQTLGTPRRLVLLAWELADKQENTVVEVIGPPRKVAFDDHGQATQAAFGFARSQGLALEELTIINTPRGEYLGARKAIPGQETRAILVEVLPRIIALLPFPKTMRWEPSRFPFVRPIRWLVALAGSQVLPIQVGGVQAHAASVGHRFLSAGPFPVSDINSYLEGCRQNYVIVDGEERKKMIATQLEELAQARAAQVIDDQELLDTVAYLTEYPCTLLGGFDQEFLSLPREVLVVVMRDAQFYFSLSGRNGELLPYFAVVTNGKVSHPEKVTEANQRVLRARLTDARFFYQQDTKVPLASRLEALKGLTFQARLGSAYDKSQRLVELSHYLAKILAPEAREVACRAALLAKADLTTQMVVEFPKLQGVMGRQYALISGERPEVAQAIYEHYLPLSYGQELPRSLAGTIVSLADKMDTIVGCFAVGLIPSGTADPYGLRRAALGIIQILMEKGISLFLNGLCRYAFSLLAEGVEREENQVVSEVLEFFKQRLFFLLNRDYPYELVDATLAAGADDPFDCGLRIQALRQWQSNDQLLPMAVAFKRVSNILSGFQEQAEIRVELLKEAAERELDRALLKAKDFLATRVAERDFLAALKELSSLKGPIDKFFDDVLVMTEQEDLRKNRLALLSEIRSLFLKVADFSRLPS